MEEELASAAPAEGQLSGAAGLALLWCTGISLRVTILAVPPLLARIHSDLHLSETEVGILTGLPVLMLALAAIPGSVLISRIGARRAMVAGLMAVAVFGAIRGFSPGSSTLFITTWFMACGIAVSQPALPSLVRTWLPKRVPMGTASFSNGYLVGEILPVAITVPVLLLIVGTWRPALMLWSIPVALTALAIISFSPHVADQAHAPTKWWPDWSNPTVWLLGFTLGGASMAYWGANAFIPDFLHSHHHSRYITAALTSLNVIQLPASFLVALAPRRLVAHRWPLCVAGMLSLLSAVGLIVLPAAWFVIDAGLLGFSTALVFVLTLTLPPLLSEDGDTHRFTAGIFTIVYICPFAGALLGGGLWDLTRQPATAFVPLIVGGTMMLLFPVALRIRHVAAA